MLIEWPTSFPPEALDVVITALRGGAVETEKAARCVYHVVGYGAGKAFGSKPAPAPAPSDPAPSDPIFGSKIFTHEDAALELSRLQQTEMLSWPQLPWDKILPILQVLLQQLLDKSK